MIKENPSAFAEAVDIFIGGGPVMIALGLISVILYGTCISTLLFINRGNLNEKDQENWNDWINSPEDSKGRVGEVIKYSLHGPKLSIKIIQRRIDEVYETIVSRIDQRLVFIGALVAIAPMTGLLGTVGGMLGMFEGLAGGSGDQGAQKIADGMKEALFTTLTGLVVALPGMFLALTIKTKRDAIANAINRLQSAIVKNKFEKI